MKKLLMFGAGALLATALVLPAFADPRRSFRAHQDGAHQETGGV